MFEKIIEAIKKLVTAGFYGKVTIHFENGRAIRIVKEESVKLI